VEFKRPTSFRLDPELLKQAAHYAIDHDTTVQEMVEQGLRHVLGLPPEIRSQVSTERPTPRKFYVVINGVECRLKEWLRQHPDILPGIDPGDKITHDLVRRLKTRGWSLVESPGAARLSPPNS
jgi:hypothetical protein